MAVAFEHSIECRVSRVFAWRFWSCVENWPVVDSSVERVEVRGPFAAGTRGSTKPRGSPATDWLLAEVDAGRTAVIQVQAPGAEFRFRWTFEEVSAGATRITQRVWVDGERAEDYAAAMKEFERGIPAGMESLAAAMVKAASGAADPER